MGKLIGESKHTIRAGNHPYTNMISKPATVRRQEYKCRKWELHLKLRDQQLKATLYTYRLLCQNLMGNANQKTTIDTYKKRKSNPNTTLKTVIKPKEKRTKNKRGREEKRPTKTNPKQLRIWQQKHTY